MKKHKFILLIAIVCLIFSSCQNDTPNTVNVGIKWACGNKDGLCTSVDVVNVVELKSKLAEIKENYTCPEYTFVGDWKVVNKDGSLGDDVSSLKTVKEGLAVQLFLGAILHDDPQTTKINFVIKDSAYFYSKDNGTPLKDDEGNLVVSFDAEIGKEYSLPLNIYNSKLEFAGWHDTNTLDNIVETITPEEGKTYTFYDSWYPLPWDGTTRDVDGLKAKMDAVRGTNKLVIIENPDELAALAIIANNYPKKNRILRSRLYIPSSL